MSEQAALLISPLHQMLEKQMKAFFSPLGDVLRGDDPNAVHDMRVASRRLQEILEVVLPETNARADIVSRIRKARRLQAKARDLDVMIERLRESEQKEAASDLGHGVALLLDHLRTRRQKLQDRLRRRLAELKLQELRSRLENQLNEGLLGGADTDEVTRKLQSEKALKEGKFLKASRLARETSLPRALHRARIAGKRFRYILEAGDGAGIQDFKPRIKMLQTIQQLLGKWHDLEVLEGILVDFCSKKRRIRRHTSALRALYRLILEGREAKGDCIGAFFKATADGLPE